MGSRDSKSSPSQNLTTDYTDNTDLHGSKEFSKTILTLQIRVIPGSSVAGFAFMEVITSFMSIISSHARFNLFEDSCLKTCSFRDCHIASLLRRPRPN